MMRPIRNLALILSVLFLTLSSCKEEEELSELEKAKLELKSDLVEMGPWEWNNHDEHAFYTFNDDGSVKIEWEKEDENGHTGEYYVYTNTWGVVDGSTFYIVDEDEDDEKITYSEVSIQQYANVSNPVFTMTTKACDPNGEDCYYETFVTKR